MGKQTKRRWQVLYELIGNKNPKVVAEIGIQYGRMTLEVLKLMPSIKTYYAIDPWLWYPDYKASVTEKNRQNWNQEQQTKFFKIFKNKTIQFKNKIKILKMLSSEASKHIPDKSLDVCFIDGNHLYKYVKEDIELYLPKVKKGGLLGGHDYKPESKIHEIDLAVNEIFKPNEFFLGSNKTWWVWKK